MVFKKSFYFTSILNIPVFSFLGEGGGNVLHGVSFFIVLEIEGGGANLKRGVYLKEHTNLSIYSNFKYTQVFVIILKVIFILTFNI